MVKGSKKERPLILSPDGISVSIPPYRPDLNCPEVAHKDFSVLPPDPHGFDRNADGIGCET
jgi:hypothetical protein